VQFADDASHVGVREVMQHLRAGDDVEAAIAKW